MAQSGIPSGEFRPVNAGIVSGDPSFVMATFDDADPKLYICLSEDGTFFKPTSSVGLLDSSTGTLRDPSIAYYNGQWVIVYTLSALLGTTFGVAASPDLVTWTEIAVVGGFPVGTDIVWAPEIFIDIDGSFHVFVSVSNDTGATFAIYEIRPTNAALTTWSVPVLVYAGDGDDLNVAIDSFVINIGGIYYLWYAGYSGGLQYIKYATSLALLGPYAQIMTADWAGFGFNCEGPCLVRLNNTTWRLFFDHHQPPLSIFARFYSDSNDLITWTPKVPLSNYQFVYRHGTVTRRK